MTTENKYVLGDFAILDALRTGYIEVDLETGRITNRKGQVLEGALQWDGYIQIKLPNPFQQQKRVGVYKHRVVYFAKCIYFNQPIPPHEFQIDHLNGNKQDNRGDNLKAVTPRQNCNNPNTKVIGEKHHNAKVSDADRKLIYSMHKEGLSFPEIIEKLHLSICKQRASQIYHDIERS